MDYEDPIYRSEIVKQGIETLMHEAAHAESLAAYAVASGDVMEGNRRYAEAACCRQMAEDIRKATV